MRVLRAFFYVVAILIFGAVLTPDASASPQQTTTPAPPPSKSDGVAPPEKKTTGWDPDLPRRARPQEVPPPFIGPYAPGEVFVSDGMGLVDVFKPDGTLLGSLNTGQELSAGMAFAQTGNLYVTTFIGLQSTPPAGVVQFDINGNLVGPFGNFPTTDDFTIAPESILFNPAGNAFVGAATPQFLDGCSPPEVTSGPVPAFEFDKNGNLLSTFTVAGQCRGTDWVELLPDQQTLLYTSEGISVLSFNINTNTQNADFADNLPGSTAYAFRVLPNGNVLVADSTVVVELNSSGQQIMTYTPNPAATALFALNLDPGGQTFWTADLPSGNVFEFEIASGTQDITFATASGSASGVAIFGEKLVGTNNLMVTDAGTGTGTVTSTPSGISCPSSCLAPFSDNSSVTLTATSAAGSTFAGFSANCVPASPQTNPPTCAVPIVTADVTVTATFSTGSSETLTVTKEGTGTGTVTSSPAGISCGTTCSASFTSEQVVVLTAAAATGSTFAGWSGAGCTGTGTCSVTMSAAEAVTATFNLSSNVTLTVTKAGTGTGTVTSSPAGISCGATCSFSFASGTSITLTATPAAGSTFTGWGAGPCEGTGTCTFTISGATTVVANFAQSTNNFTLAVTEAGTGTGTVSSVPAGINCPTTCSASFASGAVVVLTATAAEGSTFVGWSGVAGCPGTGTCTVTVSAAQTVTATFNSGTSPVTIGLAPGSPSTVNTTPGSSAVFGLTLTALPGTTGTVTLGCTSTSPNITCNIVPSNITLTGKATNVAIVVNTFCKGFVPNFEPTLPGGFGGGMALLLASMLLCGAMWTFKRRPRLALSFGVLVLVAVGMSACSSLPKSPGGTATKPGLYPLVVTATAPNGAVSSVNLMLNVLP
jgi:Divergent InlB B-repeat domain